MKKKFSTLLKGSEIMKKKFSTLLLSLALLFLMVPFTAFAVEPYSLDISDTTLTGITLHGDTNWNDITAIEIPRTITAISADAFDNCTALEKFTVEEGGSFTVDSTGALYGDSGTTLVRVPLACSLTTFVVNPSVSKIEQNAFSGCNKITTVFLPSGAVGAMVATYPNTTARLGYADYSSQNGTLLVVINDASVPTGETRSVCAHSLGAGFQVTSVHPTITGVSFSDWSEWSTVKEASCTEDGSVKRTCSCGEEETETVPKGHAMDSGTVTKEPTCTARGEKTFKCTRDGCDYSYTEVIDELGHDVDKEGTVTKQPTCTEKGEKTFKCTREGCDYSYKEVIDKLGHDMDEGTVTKQPTCTEKGEKTFKCTREGCDYSYKEVIDELRHDMDEGTLTKLPTCTEKGEKTFKCTRVGCDYYYTEFVGVDPTAHSWDEGIVTKQPTCTEKGEKKFTCQHDASHTKTEDIAIDPDAHDWDAGKITTPATCTEKGVKTFTCQREGCGETKTEEVAIDPTAHDLSDFVVSEPTAEKLGEVHSVCSRCDYDIFSHYTLKDGTSPTMYPDGSPISSTVLTPTAASTFDLNGQEIEILLQDPLGALGSGVEDVLGLTVRHTDLPATFDGDVEIEHSHSYDIIPTVNGVEKSGQLSNKVRLLYKIPQGWDKHDLEVFLAQVGEDGEFSETTEWIGDDEYLVIWTDHFSPYIFVDKLNPGEIAELEKLQNSEGSDNNANTPQDTSGNGHTSGNHSIKTGDASGEILLLSTLAMIVTGLYLGFCLKKKKSF